MTWRRTFGDVGWHFQESCPDWPLTSFEERQEDDPPPAQVQCVKCWQLHVRGADAPRIHDPGEE